jgi:ubiquinone/menaquinone biosynthesis C-methylase UbiE
VVVANYFLNVFSEQDMPQMFDTLAALLKPEGLFMIADFAPRKLGFFSASLQALYFYSAVAAFRLFAGNAWHPLYDYLPMLISKGFQVVDIEDFALFGGGPEWYRTICARKRARFLKP